MRYYLVVVLGSALLSSGTLLVAFLLGAPAWFLYAFGVVFGFGLANMALRERPGLERRPARPANARCSPVATSSASA